MYALINLPPQFGFKGKKFAKITNTVYGCDGQFFQLHFLEDSTIFRDNTIQKRKMINCVKFDPYFLLLNQMEGFESKPLSKLPDYLKIIATQIRQKPVQGVKTLISVQNLADIVVVDGQSCFIRNKQKIRQFLLRKAVNITKTIKEHEIDGAVIKTTTSSDIEITKSALKILKNVISEYFYDILKDLQISYCEKKQLQASFTNEELKVQREEEINQRIKASKKAATVAKKKAEQQNAKKNTQSQHKGGGILGFLKSSKKKQQNSQQFDP